MVRFIGTFIKICVAMIFVMFVLIFFLMALPAILNAGQVGFIAGIVLGGAGAAAAFFGVKHLVKWFDE